MILRSLDKKGSLSNVIITNVIATSESFIASSITGLEDMKVENILLSNIMLNLKGGGKRTESVNRDSSVREVPEVPAAYPENTMFGWRMLPAYAFYIRHVNKITLDNVQLRTYAYKEERHAIVADNVNGLRIMNSIIEAPKSDLPVISLIRSKNVRLFNDIIFGQPKSVYSVTNMDESEVKNYQVEVLQENL
jgi:hypothetical protein